MNYRFPTTETNSKALYISWFSPPHQKLFLVTVQIFFKSADFCLQLFFGKMKNCPIGIACKLKLSGKKVMHRILNMKPREFYFF